MRPNPQPNNAGALTPAQLQQLGELCNRMPVAQLLSLIDSGRVRFPDDLPKLSPERHAHIKAVLDSRPNPQEQAAWAAIAASLPTDVSAMTDAEISALHRSLQTYINSYSLRPTPGNHLEDAQRVMASIQGDYMRRQAEAEQREWDALLKTSATELTNYLATHPDTAHRSEIDDLLWATVVAPETRNKILAAGQYRTTFADGKHVSEAIALVREYSDWMQVKAERDLFRLHDYVSLHSGGRFASEAAALLGELKNAERERMRTEASAYSRDYLNDLRHSGVFTDEELIREGLHTRESLAILDHFDAVKEGLPDIQFEISRCRQECASGRTDIFFWGIPSTGKSCILMGLIGSQKIMVDFVSAGGPYAAALSEYLDAGCTIGQTPGEFVATIQGKATDEQGIAHNVNLVEMAGETFAFKVANNPDGEVSLSDMGNGTAELLSNNNRKVFFLIVDPTANVVAFNHFVDAPGGGRKLVRTNVNQRITLHKMVNLMMRPENAAVMKKVDYLHVIMTKSDELAADPRARDAKATELFMSQYSNMIVPIQELCQHYHINRSTNGVPKLYTFSLGNFYAGGIYQYNPADANKLIGVIHQTLGEKKQSYGDRMRNVFN